MLNATALAAAIGNGATFARGRDLAAWLGLVPRQATTGGRPKLLGISKRGNKYLRKLLERGDDEAGIGIAAGDLGLSDNAAAAAPTVQRRPHEVTIRAISSIAPAEASMLDRRSYRATLIASQRQQT